MTINPATLRNVGLFLLFCLAVMALRSIWTFPVTDSDALTKYYFAAEIYRSGDWSLLLENHHTARWVEMVPQVMLHYAFGLRYELFYLLPLLVYSMYRLDPLKPLVPLRSRYLTVFMPFAMVVVVCALSVASRRSHRMTKLLPTLAATGLFLLLVFWPGVLNYPRDSLIIIRPDAFAWRAHSEYVDLAEQVRDGKVIISGRKVKLHAHKLIALYRYPVQLEEVEDGLGVEGTRQDASCLLTVDQVPFSQNYSTCTP